MAMAETTAMPTTPSASSSLQGPPDAHPRHSQGSSNLRRSLTVIAHLAHRLDRHGRLAALVDALLLGGVDAYPLALQNEPAFHLGHHAQDRHEDAAGVRGRAKLGLKHTQPRALLFKLMDKIEN